MTDATELAGMMDSVTGEVIDHKGLAELTEHLGHERGGTPAGPKMHNGTRPKTVLTEIGPVQTEVPRG